MGENGHPYSPAELELPGFVPQRLSQGQILAPFVGNAVFSVLGAWLISGNPTASTPFDYITKICTDPDR
jgi:cholestenol delta-isomerase